MMKVFKSPPVSAWATRWPPRAAALAVALQVVAAAVAAAPIRVLRTSPLPGKVPRVAEVVVVFSESVYGVRATDLLFNEDSAVAVSGTGSIYRFAAPPLRPGTVRMSWDPRHDITSAADATTRFDDLDPSAVWQYELADTAAPTVTLMHPPAGAAVRELAQIEVTFSEPVTGVDAPDLLVAGQPAVGLERGRHGEYVFFIEPPAPGAVWVEWAAGHGIADGAAPPNPLGAIAWSYTVDPQRPAANLVINEIMAANESGLTDEDEEPQDWIEIVNRGPSPVELAGWSLTDDPDWPGQWSLPAVRLASGQYFVVFASGKNRLRATSGLRPHTSFRLSSAGEYLGLYSADSPRAASSELRPGYPEQRVDHSYGLAVGGEWRYFALPTPGWGNGTSSIVGILPPVHFSVERGYFRLPFNLTLASSAADAVIRYTTDGSVPTETRGTVYSSPIPVSITRTIRAAAFAPNWLPSNVTTHSYMMNLSTALSSLPALSLATARENLFGPTGIMETQPRNTTQRGIAWERPVSAEYILAADNSGFQIDAGLRVHGGGYIRERYNPTGALPYSKYSYRLYFRGDYGPNLLEYPIFPGCPLDVFDRIVLRAGMNDPTNPFITDELVRRLALDTGQVASHGTLAHLFLNGVHKGYYNPCERIDERFLQAWHGGTDRWDVIAQGGEIEEGDDLAWNSLRRFITDSDLSQPAPYQEAARQLDLVNFIDYLLVNAYAAMGDWPHNNWRAARERVPNRQFRFYVWDGEWAFGFANPITHNTFTAELAGNTEIGIFYRKLRANPEFRLLFADRIQKHCYGGGALTEANVKNRFRALRAEMSAALRSMNMTVERVWAPRRLPILLEHCAAQGLLAAVPTPVLDPPGGTVAAGQELSITAPDAAVYYTVNGEDPRVPFTGAVSGRALLAAPGQSLMLGESCIIRARALAGVEWSALAEATFAVDELGLPLRISEIMYNPPDGGAFEFVELANAGTRPLDLSGIRFVGIEYRFPEASWLEPGARVVIAAGEDAAAFARRYPQVSVRGWYGGALDNGGERVALLDRAGTLIESVEYGDEGSWSEAADGGGASLERLDLTSDPGAPTAWQASLLAGGTPGWATEAAELTPIALSEIMADHVRGNGTILGGWIELENRTDRLQSLAGWRVRVGSSLHSFTFPPGIALGPGEYIAVRSADAGAGAGWQGPFLLPAAGDDVFLYDATGRRRDAVTYGQQVAGFALGRAGAAAGAWTLTVPTIEAVNIASALAPATSVVLNEWMTRPEPGGAPWIELHNTHQQRPAALCGLGVRSGARVCRIATLSFVPAGGYLVLRPGAGPGPGRIDLTLSPGEGQIALLDDRAQVLDSVSYAGQIPGSSTGRLPDGAGDLVAFELTPSPGRANYLSASSGLVLSEVMARAADGAAGWVELHNGGAAEVRLDGMRLDLASVPARSWVFPRGGVPLASGAFLVLSCDPDRPASTGPQEALDTGWAMPAAGGHLILFDAAGRRVDSVRFGWQVPGLSIGLGENGWQLLSEASPGWRNAAAAGLAPPSGLRINEWLAHSGGTAPGWLELFNGADRPVALSGLALSDDPSVAGSRKHEFGPLSFLGPGGWAVWIADGDPAAGLEHLGFRLDPLGATVRLYGLAGEIIDSLDLLPQQAGVAEGRYPDGVGAIARFAKAASPGAANHLYDTDGDGMPDTWEREHGLDAAVDDGAADNDGDGVSNADEYVAGTRPRDAADRFVVALCQVSGGRVAVAFRAMPGRVYRVERLEDGRWQALRDVGPFAAAADQVVADVASGDAAASRFYRALVVGMVE